MCEECFYFQNRNSKGKSSEQMEGHTKTKVFFMRVVNQLGMKFWKRGTRERKHKDIKL